MKGETLSWLKSTPTIKYEYITSNNLSKNPSLIISQDSSEHN